MIEKAAKGVYRIQVPLPNNPLKFLNSYFIPASPGGRNLLIDTGFNMPECRAALEAGLEALGAELESTDIYLTHMHSDHIGLVPELQRTETKVYISEIDAHIAAFGMGPERWARYDAIFFAEGFSKEELEELTQKNPARAFAPDRIPDFTYVYDGDVLHYGGMELEVILVPGHTPGNTVLYCRKQKLMFLGDHVLFNITPNIISWMELENALGHYCKSLYKIQNYAVEIPLPAHRGVTCTTKERIGQILDHHQRRLEEAYSIICRNPGLGCYDIASKMTWRIRTESNSWKAFPIGQKWFAVGEAMAHMEYLCHEGKAEKRQTDRGRIGYFPDR